jgi:hypothetical protein
MLSIDLGPKNLAWVYLYSNAEEKDVEFGMINIDGNFDRGDSIVIHRCNRIQEFMNQLMNRFPKIRIFVIEKQARFNQVCNNLLYGICTIASEFGWEIFLFPPVMKFTAINQPFNTTKKAHKQLSIKNCVKFLTEYFPEKLDELNQYVKQDDIADAMNQAIIYGILHNYLWLNIEEYKKVIFYESTRFRPAT